jgi:hypothetical protein
MERFVEKALIVSFVLLLSGTSQAQGLWSLKPMAGGVLSAYAGEDTEGLKQRMGWTAGVEVGYSISQKFGVSSGLSYSQQGCVLNKDRRAYCKCASNISDANEDFYLRTKYFSVPLLAEFYVAKGLALKAGIQASILHHATEKYAVMINKYPYPMNDPSAVQYHATEYYREERYANWKSQMGLVDMTIPIGISYEYAGVVLDARYYYGLTHPFEDLDYDKSFHFWDGGIPHKARTSMLTLTLGYRFEL